MFSGVKWMPSTPSVVSTEPASKYSHPMNEASARYSGPNCLDFSTDSSSKMTLNQG